MSMDVLARWHRIVSTRDTAGLDALLAEEVVFRSPVVHTPQVGREITRTYLRAALSVLNNASFSYLETWIADRSAILEFVTTVDGIEINGVDILRWNESGEITDFKVMVRPLKAIDLLHRRMGELLLRCDPRAEGSGSKFQSCGGQRTVTREKKNFVTIASTDKTFRMIRACRPRIACGAKRP